MEFFGDIPEMLVLQLQIILKFLYVCQSGSWHATSMSCLGLRNMSMEWLVHGPMPGPCLGHVKKTFRLALIPSLMEIYIILDPKSSWSNGHNH